MTSMLVEAVADISPLAQAITSIVFLGAVTAAVYLGWPPLNALILQREHRQAAILHSTLLLEIQPRSLTVATAVAMVLLGLLGWVISGTWIVFILGAAVAVMLPEAVLKIMARRRLRRLEDQLVGGITTLASGVRAGLNLVQAMQFVARDGPTPLCQEFNHLMREYEYGVPLEEAMEKAARRIGSGDYRLLFAALATHRERGGDLGVTLDRIAESIREIQRLENRVQTLTAQGRATARWLGMMPLVIGGIYYFIDPAGVLALFERGSGNLILLVVIVLNILGFLWIRILVTIDI